jgi:hypothetical protein
MGQIRIKKKKCIFCIRLYLLKLLKPLFKFLCDLDIFEQKKKQKTITLNCFKIKKNTKKASLYFLFYRAKFFFYLIMILIHNNVKFYETISFIVAT